MELTKLQTQSVLQEFLNKENGLNDVLELLLNSLMLSERSDYLRQCDGNKGNGYRNGSVFGYGHQIELKIPRDRLSNFTSVILALFREQESYLKEVSFQLYSKGLTTRDIADVMNTIYGKHYSKSSISNMSQSFYEQMACWRNRALDTHYLAIYIDGLFAKVKRAQQYQNECFYIVLGLREDYTREIIGIVNFPSESAMSWDIVLAGLRDRGVESTGLIISDNLKGLDKSIAKHFPNTPHQKCTVHLMRHLMSYVRKEDKQELAKDLKEVLAPDSVNYHYQQAHKALLQVADKWNHKYKSLSNYIYKLEAQPYFTYLNYAIHIRRMIYTTNWIERFNKSCRRTLKVRGAFPNEESVLALITATAMEKTAQHYSYPIYNFKFDDKLKRKTETGSLIY